MKYARAVGLSTVAAALAFSIWASSLDIEPGGGRVHQHLQKRQEAGMESGPGEELRTYLPIIRMETGGQKIPGALEDEGTVEVDVNIYDRTPVTADPASINTPAAINSPADAPAVASKARLKYRGNSSLSFDKKGYRIKFVNGDGSERRVNAMGMAGHDDWALHGPYLDKTLMRNYMWYNIAGEIMDWAPDVRFCELIVDGKYQGVYVMTETVSRGRDCRLDISRPVKGTEYTGYILRLDRGSNNSFKNIEVFTNYSLRSHGTINIEQPAASRLTPEMKKEIADDFSAFEKALYSYDYDTKSFGSQNFIDTDSFVDYLILNEFTCNYDAGNLSTYLYKDLGGKIKTAVWDFNSACDNYLYVQTDPMVFQFQYNVWYYMLAKDDRFTKRVISRYRELRKTYLSEEYLLSYIDEVQAYLGKAVNRNYSVWGYTFDESRDLLRPAERNPRDYDEAIEQMKAFIVKRGKWMDENIELLRQYSHESKVKKFNH